MLTRITCGRYRQIYSVHGMGRSSCGLLSARQTVKLHAAKIPPIYARGGNPFAMLNMVLFQCC